MKKNNVVAILIFSYFFAGAQLPQGITSWVLNTTGAKGYDSIETNVQLLQYSDSNVYVSCTCIPGYSIGPWNGSPATPSNQNFVFKITRFPQQNTGTAVPVGGGHTGVLSNGVSIFSAQDANTYNNDGVWHQNGYVFEYPSFDNCVGHPQQQGEYHHHVSPKCLYDQTDSLHHSPIIGYAFDGFPIYGAYGYSNVNGTGGIKRMASSFQLRNITTRTTLPDGSTASATGPAVSAQSPLGNYLEDYVYTAGSGDLDVHNGRFCVTPEYPNGIYAYFMSIDAALKPVYPYTLGTSYYGIVQAGNTDVNGPGSSGHNAITETTTVYNAATSVEHIDNTIKFEISPNPVSAYAYVYLDPLSANNIKSTLYNSQGQIIQTFSNWQPSISYSIDLTQYASGTYFLRLENNNKSVVQKIIKVN